MIQGKPRSAQIAKTGAPLEGQHTNDDADFGSSTPSERIGLHGGTPNKAGADNNQATRQSTAKGCVTTDTHCVSLKDAQRVACARVRACVRLQQPQRERAPEPQHQLCLCASVPVSPPSLLPLMILQMFLPVSPPSPFPSHLPVPGWSLPTNIPPIHICLLCLNNTF